MNEGGPAPSPNAVACAPFPQTASEFARKNVLYDGHSVEDTAKHFDKPLDEMRAGRTAWNGLMISAYAKAAQVLREARYLEAARRAADFLLARAWDEQSGTLLRRYRDGEAGLPRRLRDVRAGAARPLRGGFRHAVLAGRRDADGCDASALRGRGRRVLQRENYTCKMPTTDRAQFAGQLEVAAPLTGSAGG